MKTSDNREKINHNLKHFRREINRWKQQIKNNEADTKQDLFAQKKDFQNVSEALFQLEQALHRIDFFLTQKQK